MGKVNWNVILGVLAFCVQLVAGVQTLGAYQSDMTKQIAILSQQVSELNRSYDDTQTKLDYVYRAFFDRGFNK